MSKTDFDVFINQQAKVKSDKSIDWEAERDEWLKYLSVFYKKVEGFLKEYVTDGRVACKYTEQEIFEEYIGSYSAKALNIELGSHKLKLEPIGTNIIGAKGRVDLIGANGKVRFVLVNKNASTPKIKLSVSIKGEEPPKEEKEPKVIEWEWKIATRPPRIQYINLEQDTFLEALMEVVGG
jgi:hypothetical protein